MYKYGYDRTHAYICLHMSAFIEYITVFSYNILNWYTPIYFSSFHNSSYYNLVTLIYLYDYSSHWVRFVKRPLIHLYHDNTLYHKKVE